MSLYPIGEPSYLLGDMITQGWLESPSLYIQQIGRVKRMWNGEGLPPVGTICEYMWNYKPEGSEYVQVEILVHDKGSAIMRALDGPSPGVLRECRGGYCGPGKGQPIFRPIRTPEQIAADEREADSRSFIKIIMTSASITTEHNLEATIDKVASLYSVQKKEQPK